MINIEINRSRKQGFLQVVFPAVLADCPLKGIVVSAKPWKLIKGTMRPGLHPAAEVGSDVGYKAADTGANAANTPDVLELQAKVLVYYARSSQ